MYYNICLLLGGKKIVFSHLRIAHKLAIGIITMLVLMVSILIPVSLNQINELILDEEKEFLESLQLTFQGDVHRVTEEALMLVTAINSAPGVTEAFANRDRAKLRELTMPVYEALKKSYDISQFQFHIPPARSFLRLHNPGKYGDNLSGFRDTVVTTNSSLLPQMGIEKGTNGIGLRGVEPVLHNGQHIGSAEIGLAFDQGFIDHFTREYKVPAAIHIASDRGFDTFGSTIKEETTLSDSEFAETLSGRTVFKQVNHENQYWAVMAKPLKSFSGEIMGVVEILIDLGHFQEAQRNVIIRIIAVGFLALLGAIFISSVFSRSVSKPIEALTHAAEEISRGDFNQSIVGTERKDEIGGLARAVERMAASIKLAMERFQQK